MNISDSMLAGLVAAKLAGEPQIMECIRQHVAALTEKAELLTPRVAAQLLKVDQRTLSQIATPVRLTHRVTRYKLSEITHLSQ